jgi:DNA-binding transcriptional LysR family regulator
MIDKLGLLERFTAVVTHGSVRRAAEALNLSQPALSRSIRLLEDDFGTPLFTREARGLVLTRFGERVLSVATRLARDWEMSRAALLASGVDFDGVMRVGAGPFWAAVVLPAVVPRLHRMFPRLGLEVERRNPATIVDWMKSGRVDLCLGVRPSAGLSSQDFETVVLGTFRDRVFARSRHPIHACDPADLEALHRYPWLVYTEMPSYRAETEHLIRERTGRLPNIVTSTNSLALLLRVVEEEDYLCFLPDGFAQARVRDPLRMVPMDIGHGVHQTGATFRRTHADFEPLRGLIDLCRAYFSEPLGPQVET